MTKSGLGKANQALLGLSILIGGKNTFGQTGEKTKVPTFEFNTIDDEPTGIVKRPKMTLEVNNLGAEYIAHMAANLPFVLKGNIEEDGVSTSYLITAQGSLTQMGTELKEGDKTSRSFELSLNMYSEVVDNVPTIEYVRHPYVCILAGVVKAPNFNENI